MSDSDTLSVQGVLRLFGHDDSRADLTLIPRSTAWRGVRAGPLAGGGLALAVPLVLLPPHGAWSLAVAVTGLVLGGRKWSEHFTLVKLEGPCPRCGETIVLEGPARFKNGAGIDCAACNHTSKLSVDEVALQG